MQLNLKIGQDSYSLAAKERMSVELNLLAERLNEVGSALATLNLFRRVDIEIDGKRRRLNDFAQIDLGPDPTAGTFKVIIHNQVAFAGVISTLKENGYLNIDTSSKRELRVVKPRLTAQQEDDLETEAKRVTKATINKLAAIKSDALQRVQAAIKAEFIEPRESKLAVQQLDALMDEAKMHASVVGLIRRKQLIGGGITFDGPEEEALYRKINDRIYRDVAQDMLTPKLADEDDD